MKYELWTLAVSDPTGDPWATVHVSHDAALRHVLAVTGVRLPADAPRTEMAVDAALTDIASFTIELAIIDTDELEST